MLTSRFNPTIKITVPINRKGNIHMSINKRVILYIAVGLTVALAVVGVFAMNGNNKALSPAELLSLGEKYLSELDYEQALVQFQLR